MSEPRVVLLSWRAVLAIADANPRADVLATGSGMSVRLPDATYVGIRPGGAR